MLLYSIFRTGIEGNIAEVENLRSAQRFLPDNIYDAIKNFHNAEWKTKLLGEDVKERFVELKKASADRCPRLLGTVVKAPEVQFHNEVYTQFLWNLF
jgi:glutamine synthetase